MIKLINNEIKKNKIYKLVIYFLLIFISIYLIVYFNYKNNNDNVIETIYNLIPFLGILICTIFSKIVNGEMNEGTFKIYLTKGYKRYKVLLAKLIYIYIFIFLLLLVVILSYYICINKYYDFNYNKDLIKQIIIHYVPVIFIGSLCLLSSIIINNISLCVSMNITLCLLSNVISQILLGYNIKFIEYTFLPYLDLSIYSDQSVIEELNSLYNVNLSIRNGIIILILNTICFILISFNIFTKKDIKC